MKQANKKTKIAKIATVACIAACVGAASMFAACSEAPHEHAYGAWQVTGVTDARVTISRTCPDCTAEDATETKNIGALTNTGVWKAEKSDDSGNIKYTNAEYGLTYYDWAMEFESAVGEDDGFSLSTAYSGGYFAAGCVQMSGGNGISATSQNAVLTGTVTFIFTAKSAGKATLKLTAASDIQAATQDATEDYRVSPETGVTVKINNVDYTYTPDTILGNDGADYDNMFEVNDPHTITLGEIDLKQGTNTITFTFGGSCHLHCDCIHLLTGVDGSHQLGYYEE